MNLNVNKNGIEFMILYRYITLIFEDSILKFWTLHLTFLYFHGIEQYLLYYIILICYLLINNVIYHIRRVKM